MTPEDRHRKDLAALAQPYRRPDRWAPVPLELDVAIAEDAELAQAARTLRARAAGCLRPIHVAVPSALGAAFARAFEAVPRERFVLPDDIATSVDDAPQVLDVHSRATVSAPHAYLLTFALLDLQPGDWLLELGTGTGYGAALGRRIVGRRGHVTSVEIDARLHERARRLTPSPAADEADVELLVGDARAVGLAAMRRRPHEKVAVTYALDEDPRELVDLLPGGGVLVAPIAEAPGGSSSGRQTLVRFAERGARTTHGAVRYVAERRSG